MSSRRHFLTYSVAAALAWAAPAADIVVRVDPASRLQVFDGWGTSLCWWANVAGNFPKEVRDELAENLFTLNGQGLGLTILRFNAGGGENPHIRNTMEPRARMEGYWPGPDQDFDWNADHTQRQILEDAIVHARAAGLPLRFEVFGNSPPWWMTISGSVTGNTGMNGKPVDNLGNHYADYARYLLRVAQFLEERYGITVESISPFNEPSSDWWKYGGRQEGCFFSRPSMARLVATLAPMTTGTHFKIAATEDWSIDQMVESWDSFDPQTRASIDRINLHTYSGTRRREVRERAKRDGKKIWMSEVGDGDGTGTQLARTILSDLKELGASAWVNWQALSPDEWGMIWNDHVHPDWRRLRKFYVMAQFSRYIRPGAHFIGVDQPGALAALDAGERHLVLVYVNSGKTPATVRFDLSRFPGAGPEASWTQTEMTATPGDQLASKPAQSVRNGTLAATVAASSVSTFVVPVR